MKQLTYITTLAFILTACGINSSQTKSIAPISVTDSMQTFKLILNGNWYQASYIDSIQETKSPFRSQNVLTKFPELKINSSEARGDSIQVEAIGIHEASNFIVYFKPGLTSTSLPTNIIDYDTRSNFYELGYNISHGDTSLVLSIFNKDKKITYQIQYLKAPKNSEGPLQYMVNKTLFAGSYKVSDSSGQISILNFTSGRQLYGLPNYQKYYVLTDFVAESDNVVDQICFDIQTNNQRCYGFTIQADTINLYDLRENIDTIQLGRLKYKLVKE